MRDASAIHNQIQNLLAPLSDAQRLQNVALHDRWQPWQPYAVGAVVRHAGALYRCLTAHTSEDTWFPTQAPSLWARILIPDPAVVPVWVQPDSTNPYSKGDRVRWDGKIWMSDIDGNVWQPGIYGWMEAT